MRKRQKTACKAVLVIAACAVLLAGCGDAAGSGGDGSVAVSQSAVQDTNSVATGAYPNDVKPMSNGKKPVSW